MRPSPTRAEAHRPTSPRAASRTASPATASAPMTTTSRFPGVTPESMTDFSSNGTAAALAAAITVVTRKTEMCRQYGRA